MASPNKTIALKPFIYDELVKLKRGNDTFTDVIERELKKAKEYDKTRPT
jgi:predicted CopG family antitoxin